MTQGHAGKERVPPRGCLSTRIHADHTRSDIEAWESDGDACASQEESGVLGVDGMTPEELRPYTCANPGEVTSAIRTGKYCPAPVKRGTIHKPEKGKLRDLGIQTVTDRLVQQAVAQVLAFYFDVDISNLSHGFRPMKGAQDAIHLVTGKAVSGYVWAVDMNLEKFFDTVDHSRLTRKFSTRIKDRPEDGEVGPRPDAMGLLSPLLASIYLDELDKELERRGHQFAKHVDDLIILCKSKRAAQRTLASVTRNVENE